MAIKFSRAIREQVIAPGVSEFDRADIPEMSGLSKSWISRHFLNSALRNSFEPPFNAYFYNYLRRTEASFYAYSMARTEALKFLANPHQSPRAYAFALFHWETFLGQSWHAFELLEKAFKVRLISKGSSSALARLKALYNQMKHVAERIEKGKIIDDATVPVWLTNNGLVSVDKELSYRECAEILTELAEWAEVLVDPRTASDKLRDTGSSQDDNQDGKHEHSNS